MRYFVKRVGGLGLLAIFFFLPRPTIQAQVSFGPVTPLNTNATMDVGLDVIPTLVTDGAGVWVAVWESDDPLGLMLGSDRDILFSRSVDNGATWSPPLPLNQNAATDGGDDVRVHLATNGSGRWLAVWRSDDTLGGTLGPDEDILFSISDDAGVSWSFPAALNTNAAGDAGDDLFPQIVSQGANIWTVVWSSDDPLAVAAGTDYDILFSRSTNNGVAWSAPAILNTNALMDLGADGQIPGTTVPGLALATDGLGTLIATWTSDDPSFGSTFPLFDIEIVYSRSTNNGVSWSTPAALNTNTANLAFDIFPKITTDGAGTWVAMWSSDDPVFGGGGFLGGEADIIFARSTDNGVSWSPSAALNTTAAGDTGSDGFDIILAAIFSYDIRTDGSGLWIAVWPTNEPTLGGGGFGGELDIVYAISTDSGATWGAPIILNGTQPGESGLDGTPSIAHDGMGNWVLIWASADDQGGTIGTDLDLLVTTNADPEADLFDGATPIANGGGPIDFGTGPLGGPALSRTFRLENNGLGALTTANLTVPAPFMLTESLDSSIASSASDTFTIDLPTAGSGVFNVQVSFETNDLDENPYAFTISGTITDSGEVEVSPPSLAFDFHVIGGGPSNPMSVLIVNSGAGTLNFTGAGLALTGLGAAEFAFTSPPDISPIPPTSGRFLDIVFDPSTVGAKSARLVVTTDDADEPTLFVDLTGIGVEFSATRRWTLYD